MQKNHNNPPFGTWFLHGSPCRQAFYAKIQQNVITGQTDDSNPDQGTMVGKLKGCCDI